MSAGPRVRALVQRYQDEQAPARTATTRRGSQDRLRYFLDFVQGDSLEPQDVLGYARFVQERSGRWGRPLSPFTRVAYLMAVQHFLRWATRSGYLLQDLAGLVVFKRPSSLPRPLSEDEMQALIKRGPRDVRVRAILELLYGTGLRASELIRLTREDVDLEEGLLRVRLGKRQKDRVVPFGERVRQALLAYMQARARRRNPTLFLTRAGKPLSRELLLVLVVAAGERAGLVRRVSPHRLRHSFATHMLRNGAPLQALQRLLGHQSVRSTEAYLEVEVQDLGRMIQKSHPRERCKR